MKLLIKNMYKTMSRVNIKHPKKQVKTIVKKDPEIKEIIKEIN